MQSSYYFPKGSLNTPRENNIPSNLFKKKNRAFLKIFATSVLQMVHSFPSLCRNCLCKALNAEKRRLNEVFDPRVYFKCREKLLTGLNAVF